MVRIDKIISVTAGRFHCWVESPVGIIRKPNAAVPQDLWDIFEGRKEVPKIKVVEASIKSVELLPVLPGEIKWWQKLWLKIKNYVKRYLQKN